MKDAFVLGLLVVTACERPRSSSSRVAASASAPAATVLASVDASAPHVDPPDASAGAKPGAIVTFEDEASAAAFETVVGDWTIATVAGATGLEVDGSRWRNGTPSANLADQAKRLYGDRYAEFLDGVKAFAFFPLAVKRDPPPAAAVRLSVRFYPIGGRVDQAAGIAFGVANDGSYLGVRANALEDNILFFKVVRGKRTILETVRNVPTPSKSWHVLVVELRGTRLRVELDGTPRLDRTLEAAPAGRVGLWSKADSQVLFDDFEIAAL